MLIVFNGGLTFIHLGLGFDINRILGKVEMVHSKKVATFDRIATWGSVFEKEEHKKGIMTSKLWLFCTR